MTTKLELSKQSSIPTVLKITDLEQPKIEEAITTKTLTKSMAAKLAPEHQKHYLKNSELLLEVIDCKEKKVISNKLMRMLIILAERYASRPNFSGYTYIKDMQSEALADLCKNALKFNPAVSSNPFAFYTSCIHNSFLGYLNSEKKQRKIRDAMLVEIGENPSYSFQAEYNASLGDSSSHFQDDMRSLMTDIDDAKKRQLAEKNAAAQLAAEALEIVEDSDPQQLIFEDDITNN